MEVYDRPATLFAARFIGSPPMNLIEAEVTNGRLTAAGGLNIAAPEGVRRGDRVIAGVRPENFRVSTQDDDGARGRIVSREALGDETIYVVETAAGLLNVRMPPTARFDEEQSVSVRHEGAAPPVYECAGITRPVPAVTASRRAWASSGGRRAARTSRSRA